MASVLDGLPKGSRVLLIRLRSLGDCVLTTPAIALLKQYRPDLRLAVAVEDRFRAVFEGNPAVERLLGTRLASAAAWRPRLSINLHGGTKSVQLTLASLASLRAGFSHFRHQWAYNVRIPRAQEILGEERPVHTAEHVASAMFFLGVERREVPRAQLFAVPEALAQPFAVIHPMASAPEKAWPAENFRQLAHWIESSWKLEVVFIAGPGEDLTPFEGFRKASCLPLEETKALISGASLFVGNDSGPAHMAAAFGIPEVVLFGPSDPVVWAPWRTEAQVIISQGPLREVTVQTVADALERLRVRV